MSKRKREIEFSSDVKVSGILNWSTNPQASTSYYKELGFTATDTGSATSLTGTNVISLERPTSLFVEIKELGSNSGAPLNFYDQNTFSQSLSFNRNYLSLSTVSVRLLDRTNSVVSITGVDWQMILEFELW